MSPIASVRAKKVSKIILTSRSILCENRENHINVKSDNYNLDKLCHTLFVIFVADIEIFFCV